ncbi:Retinol dehydrogenase 13 [Linderina macrospora]|uniref:Retinol dehydrogenase 13 n=1 Tax=Linderina macrospora TaxID=4868 RepID=A0ACC1JD13_9FUNG|nr:Retinol dehydrogenase 13 [Linderina macrospora]
MLLTTFFNALVYWICRPFMRAGPFQVFGNLTASYIDFCYATFYKLITNSQKETEKLIASAVKNGTGKGKIAIVTGANSGIGYDTAKVLGQVGYHTILACRNLELGEQALTQLTEETGRENFELMSLNLASFESINKFVEEFKERHGSLHLLVNNGGVCMCPYSTTAEGLELQFGTNYVGHFVLTNALLDVLRRSGPSKIVNLSSLASYMNAGIDRELVTDKSKYNQSRAYYNSKLALVLFAATLARKLEGTGITANSINPGYVATNIFQHIGLSAKIQNMLFANTVMGSLTTLAVVLDQQYANTTGQYFVRCQPTYAHPSANSIKEQDELWGFTEELIAKHSDRRSYGTFL